MEVIKIAQVCHEANKAYCEALGDMSQVAWDQAPDWQKQSAILGVQFHIANPQAGDAASHDSWLNQKVSDGWVFGSVKNPETKEHPCMVPFTCLPVEQQKKDALFRSIVHALAGV